YADPSPVTELIWFKAPTSGAQGSLIGFTSVQTDSSPGSWDRMLWIDSTGHLVYGVYPGSTQELTSPGTYTDGKWHFVVASVGSGGEQLWVDGSEVASNASVTSAQSYTGWWHIGDSNAASGWPDGPTSNYWNGSLAQAAIVPTQLTASQIATLAQASASSGFKGDVLALDPTSYWPLDNLSTSACAGVLVDIQATTGSNVTCLYPAASGDCSSTPPGSAPLSELTSVAMPALVGSTLTVLTRMVLSTASPTGVLGLHVIADLQFDVTRSSWSAQAAFPSASGEM
ncbi:MAG: LamG-like jellyroll fold domain-containing protein, partial [Acidimicrobiales bacterium]